MHVLIKSMIVCSAFAFEHHIIGRDSNALIPKLAPCLCPAKTCYGFGGCDNGLCQYTVQSGSSCTSSGTTGVCSPGGQCITPVVCSVYGPGSNNLVGSVTCPYLAQLDCQYVVCTGVIGTLQLLDSDASPGPGVAMLCDRAWNANNVACGGTNVCTNGQCGPPPVSSTAGAL